MKTRLAFLTALLFAVTGSVFAQGVFVTPKTVFGTINGVTRPIASPTVTVCAANISGLPCSPALSSTLFKDQALTQPLSNPFTGDANGNYSFAIAAGTYTVTETASGYTGYSYQLTVSCPLGGMCTWSGTQTFAGTIIANNGITVTGTGQFNGQIITNNLTMGGGATATNSGSGGVIASVMTQTSAATSFGSNLSTQTITMNVPNTGPLFVNVQPVQSLAGASCGAGTNTVSVTLNYTAPGGTASSVTFSNDLSISANGALDSNSGVTFGAPGALIIAKSGTGVTYSTSSTLASAGCSPTPQYTVYAKATL